MIITIDNTEYRLKYTLRGYMIFEQITNHSFNGNGMSDFITLFYSMVMASNKEATLDFETFIDWLDETPKKLHEFSEWIGENIRKQNSLSPNKEDVKGESDPKN